MPIPSATSITALAAEKLREMFAASATFQGEAGGSSAASSHIYFESIPDPSASAFPFPVVVIGFTQVYRRFRINADDDFRQNGWLSFSIMRKTDSAYYSDNASALMDIWNFAGNVIDDVTLLARSDSSIAEPLRIQEMVTTDVYEAEAKWDSSLKFWICEGLVYWGDVVTKGNS